MRRPPGENTPTDKAGLHGWVYAELPVPSPENREGRTLRNTDAGTPEHKYAATYEHQGRKVFRFTHRPSRGAGLPAVADTALPNAGFPLPGHVLTTRDYGPGSEVWRERDMDSNDW